MELAGKVAVVTGSGNGIGEAIARRFVAEGAHVVITDIDAAAVERVAAELGASGVAGDITDERTVAAVAEAARSTYGEIDVWMSNAGIAGAPLPGDLQDDAVWDLQWRLHVLAHVHAARHVLPAMVARGNGYLLNTASTVALSVQVDKAPYSVTKHAALALAEWLAVHHRPLGVKVSCFCPGPMLTRMLRANAFDDDHPAMKMALTPEQVAEVVVRGIAAERFLILTHEGDEQPLIAKATDYDAWLNGATRRLASLPDSI